jgi:hypothetical protein
MRKLMLAAVAVAVWAQSANATETLEGHLYIDGVISRVLNFDNDQSAWLPSCAGQATCTYSDTYPVFTVFNRSVVATSEDGVLFTMTLDDDYSGLVSLELQAYPYFTDGTFTVSALRSMDGQFQVTDVQFSSTVTSDRFTGNLQLQELTSASFVAVPEPSTWAMMLLGFSAIGGLMRWKRARNAVAARCRRTRV